MFFNDFFGMKILQKLPQRTVLDNELLEDLNLSHFFLVSIQKTFSTFS